MTAGRRPLCDCDEPCGCYAEGYAPAREKHTSRSWPAWRDRPTRRAAPASPAR